MGDKGFKNKLVVSLVAGSMILQPIASLNQVAIADTVTGVVPVVSEMGTFTVGQVYEGFKLERKIYSNDLNCDVYLFVHETSGGQLVYVDSPDKNKWFSVTFKTPTVDDTGVNHIFEHAVLEGSKKYPVKSPFTEMGKRTVSTFMNAMTAYDYTYYPIASENEKDFDNLMRVYLDAVFAPLVVDDYRLFQQEGWRYEVDEATGELVFNGVVFNEMKGAMSDQYSTLYDELKAELYPNTKYRFNSGGDPYHIVDLSHKELASKHEKYYNPSNACITIYGKMDLVSKLKYINDEYYGAQDKAPSIMDKKYQKPFEAPKNMTKYFPSYDGATKEENSMLLQSTALSNTTPKDRLGLNILSLLLSQGENSVLYNEMVKSGLGMEIYVELVQEYYQPAFSFILLETSSASMDTFKAKIDTALRDTVKNGFDKERIEGVFNLFELSYKEGLLKADRGDSVIESINKGFVRYDDPLLLLNESSLLEEIKKEAMNGKYFEGLIEKYLLGNPHQVNIAFEPDADYMMKMEEKIIDKLQARMDKMTETAMAAEKAMIRSYNVWQDTPDSDEVLKTLPTLSLNDLDLSKMPSITTESTLKDTKLLKHTVNALGLTETAYYFDLKGLTQDELAYLDLFLAMLESGNMTDMTNEKHATQVSKYTTGLSMFYKSFGNIDSVDDVDPYFVIKADFMSENADTVNALMLNKMTQVNFADKELMRTKLNEVVEGIKSEKLNDPHATISSRIRSRFTANGAFNNIRLSEGFEKLSALNNDFDNTYEDTLKVLNGMYAKVFNKAALTVSIATDEKSFDINEKASMKVVDTLKTTPVKADKWTFDLTPEKVAYKIPAEVQFIQYGFNMNAIGEEITGQDIVFANILSDGYMYENIRVRGGAYGGYMVANMDGTVRFLTYRDPNLKESIVVIEDVIAYLKANKPSQDEIDNAIISILGRMELGMDAFDQSSGEAVDFLTKYNNDKREMIKKQIMGTTVADVDAFIAKLEKGLKVSSLVVAGSDEEVENNKALFDMISAIQD